MSKRMILVTSPPASGKTFVSQQLAKSLPNVVYLDKDALIPLSHRIFHVAGEYVASRNYTTPDIPALEGCLVKFYNSTEEEFNESINRITKLLLD